MKNISDIKNRYYKSYNDILPNLPGLGLDWMKRLRDDAIKQFHQDGFPDKSVEEWNVNSFKGLTDTFYMTQQEDTYEVDYSSIEKKDAECLVRVIFHNGKIISIDHDELPKGVQVNSLKFFIKNNSDFLKEKIKPANEYSEARLSNIIDSRPQSIVALNAAFHEDGAIIHIDKNIEVPGYIELMHIGDYSENSMKHIRSVIFLDKGSKCEVIENIQAHKNNNTVFTSDVTDIHLSEGSSLSYNRFIRGNSKNIHVNNVHAQLDKGSEFISNSLINCDGQARNEVRINLLGEHAISNVNVLMMGKNKSLHETLTKVKHATKNTKSVQVIRTILDQNSRGSFQGKIRVEEGADGTLAEMSGKSLLLSDQARVNAKPELEILADDVKCSHGVTVGTLSKEQLFYLQSRGIPEHEARKLLINSFSNTIISNISNILIKRAENFILENYNENG